MLQLERDSSRRTAHCARVTRDVRRRWPLAVLAETTFALKPRQSPDALRLGFLPCSVHQRD